MITIDGARVYGWEELPYKQTVPTVFTIGDAIRKARVDKGWNQSRLGEEAERYRIGDSRGKVAINTVSKVERDPYTSEFSTVIRLVFAAGLKLSDVQRYVEEATSISERAQKKRAG